MPLCQCTPGRAGQDVVFTGDWAVWGMRPGRCMLSWPEPSTVPFPNLTGLTACWFEDKRSG